MALVDVLKDRIKVAMKTRQVVEKGVLRVVVGNLQNLQATTWEEDQKRNRPFREFTDDDTIRVIRRAREAAEETLRTAREADRPVVEAEIAILQGLLPQAMTRDEVRAALSPLAADLRAYPKDGPAIGRAVRHLKESGAAAGGDDVKAVVSEIRA